LGEPFIAFDSQRTVKEGILGKPRLGPKSIKDTEEYLKLERPARTPTNRFSSATRKVQARRRAGPRGYSHPHGADTFALLQFFSIYPGIYTLGNRPLYGAVNASRGAKQ